MEFSLSEPVSIYQTAMETAQQRSAQQWAKWRFNRFSDFPTRTIDPEYIDPWYEYDLQTPTAAERLVNAYYVWCYLRWRRYSNISIATVLWSMNLESGISGGVWQGGYHPQGMYYDTDDPTGETWVTRGGALVREVYEVETVIDPQTGLPVTQYVTDGSGNRIVKYAAGSWAALTYSGDDLQASIPATGYAFVQWTPYLVLRSHAGYATGDRGTLNPDGTRTGAEMGDGYNFWPLNGTLCLMTLDMERAEAMQYPTYTWAQRYLGEWNQQGGHNISVTWAGTTYTLNRNVLWDEFAEPAVLLGEVFGDDVDDVPEFYQFYVLLAIWGKCYLHHNYITQNPSEITPESYQYWADAVEYWSSINGADNPVHIPRAHSIKDCPLDVFHLHPALIAAVSKRRANNVRTVLL